MRRVRPKAYTDDVWRMTIPVEHVLSRQEIRDVFLHYASVYGADDTVRGYLAARKILGEELERYGADMLEPVEEVEESGDDDEKWAEDMTELIWPILGAEGMKA